VTNIENAPDRSLKVDPHETLWVTDAELIRRAGVPAKIARAAIEMLDHTKGSGFPPKQRLWGNRRYWPAVKAYFDKAGGLLR
jgi:hypothetical protein